MTELLEKAFKAVSNLPDELQDEVAILIQETLKVSEEEQKDADELNMLEQQMEKLKSGGRLSEVKNEDPEDWQRILHMADQVNQEIAQFEKEFRSNV